MINWKKPVQTRDGRPVRVLCMDAAPPRTVVALVGPQGDGQPRLYLPDGHVFADCEDGADLVNAPEGCWVLLWRHSGYGEVQAQVYRFAADAEAGATLMRQAGTFVSGPHNLPV